LPNGLKCGGAKNTGGRMRVDRKRYPVNLPDMLKLIKNKTGKTERGEREL